MQFLVASIALLHPPSRAYVEPWTGDLFGEGGVEKDLHIYPDGKATGVHGDVIMSKLGNATAKCVPALNMMPTLINIPELSLDVPLGNCCESQHLLAFREKADASIMDSHTMTLRFPEVR